MRMERGGDQPRRLVESHTVSYITSELLLAKTAPARRAPVAFSGIGDPVYNLADPRFANDTAPGSHSLRRRFVSFVPATFTSSLGRLAGSGREVRRAATLFLDGQMLLGPDATGVNTRTLVENRMGIVHFAAHVVSRDGHPEQAALALTLGRDRLPELLTPELIATYKVPGSLVVLSGCDSEQGKVVPGVGVMGLSRAWLQAGASAVVVSTWPTPDDGGAFFYAFYRNIAERARVNGSLPRIAASALADAQNEMRASAGYRNSPSFWGAYTVLSKE